MLSVDHPPNSRYKPVKVSVCRQQLPTPGPSCYRARLARITFVHVRTATLA